MSELELKVKGEYSENRMKPWETLLSSVENNLTLQGHFNARSLDEAGHLLRVYRHKRARLTAGGTGVLPMLRRKYVSGLPGVLVNIKTVPNLSYIKEESGVLKIGALTTLSDLENSALVRAKCAVLAETASVVGSPQIRNMATIAGSLCQDVNCWYYRAEKDYFHCLRKGGDGCPAIKGDNRWMFSIFGTAEGCGCYATCQSDMAVTLSALGATLKTTHRVLPLREFYVPAFPGNILNTDEIITEVRIPLCAGIKAKYTKFSIRKSLDRPLISVACAAQDGEVRLVIGGVSLLPYFADRITGLLCGKAITPEMAEKAGRIAIAGAVPMSMNGWKAEVTRVLVKRTLLELI